MPEDVGGRPWMVDNGRLKSTDSVYLVNRPKEFEFASLCNNSTEKFSKRFVKSAVKKIC